MEKEESRHSGDIPSAKPPDELVKLVVKNLERELYFEETPLILANFPHPVAQGFLDIGIRHHVGAQDFIIRQGQIEKDMFIICEGSVSILRQGVRLTHLKKGDVFGELIILGGRSRIASVSADTEVILLSYCREVILDFFARQDRKYFDIYLLNMIEILRRRLLSSNQRVCSLEQQLLQH